MDITYPNPWDFTDSDLNLTSPDGKYKVDYENFGEIAMGGPIGGRYTITIANKIFIISDWASGPVIWNKESTKVAFPSWTKNRKQKVTVADIDNLTITIYKLEFRVLHITGFTNNIITGIDSPIYKAKEIIFNIENEVVEKTILL